MFAFFFVLFLLSLLTLIIGLIKPNVFSKIGSIKPGLIPKISTRKRVLLVFGLATLITFIISLVIVPPVAKKDSQQTVTPNNPNSQDQQSSAPEAVVQDPNEKIVAQIIKVVDGDTIEASTSGRIETIRLIGINTPETVDPRKTVECFGSEASNRAKEILSGKVIYLEADPGQGERDKYQRLLRYVWLDEKTSFNKMMISEGYAYEYTYATPYKYQVEFKQAEKEARESNRGLWSPNTCSGDLVKPTSNVTAKPTSTPTVRITPAATTAPVVVNTTQSASGNCKYSCTSPDRDCADFATHAEAQAFFGCCGYTAANDPMKLDSVGIGDGIACESLP